MAALERAAGQPAPVRGEQKRARPEPHLRVHGANLDLQPGAFQNQVEELLRQTSGSVTFVGKYDHEELASLMAEIDWVVVPSIWWENSPLVIQEAFHFGRPVICSDIGGMAEKVDHWINGLHFRADDASRLARVMEEAAERPGLWEHLRDGIRPMYSMQDHAGAITSMYRELLERTATTRAR